MSIVKKILLFIFICLLSTFMIARTGSAIIGKVITDEGTVIAGVKVLAESPALMGTREVTTDKNGRYRLFNLPQGIYKLKYECERYTTIIKDQVELSFEQTLSVSVHMEMGSSSDVINDKSKNPVIDVKSTVVGKTINKENFDKLPKGRDFTSMISIIPGVNNEASLSGISIGGASGSENKFYIDGVDISNIRTGFQGQMASFDFIDLVQVKTSGFMAEYGGAPGGVINAITRSGGNEFHGDVLAYYSGSVLRGTPSDILTLDRWSYPYQATYNPYGVFHYNSVKVDEHILETGFSFGGFILKNKIWFFGSFLPRLTFHKRITSFNNSSGYSDADKSKNKALNGMIKISMQLLKNTSLSISYLNSLFSRQGFMRIYFGPYDGIYPDLNYDWEEGSWPNYSLSTSLDIAFEKSFLNIRGGLFYTNRKNPQKPIPNIPLYKFRESAMGGYSGTNNLMFSEIPTDLQHTEYWQNYGSYDSRSLVKSIAEKKSISLDYTVYFNALGEHSLKFGGQFLRQGEDVDNSMQEPIIYLGWDRSATAYGTDYGRGDYGYYIVRGNDITGAFGNKYKAYSNHWAFYLQDSWTFGERLTINYGIRVESEYLPSYSDHPDFANIKPIKFGFGDKLAPRIGFVYDLKGDSSLKIFGSFGIFFDVLKLEQVVNYYNGFKWKDAAYTLDDWDYTKIGVDGYYPGEQLYLLDFRTPSYEYIDKGLKPSSIQNISLGIEKKISDNILLSINILNKHLRYGIKGIITLTPQGEEYSIANPGYVTSKYNLGWGEIICQEYPDIPKAKREYWSLTASLDKRFSNNWMGGISYRWSRLTGNYIGNELSEGIDSYFSSIFGGNRWWQEFDKELNVIDGLLPSNRTHVIKAYGSYLFPFGLTLGSVINIMSGTPVTEEWCISSIFYPYNRGNLGRTPMIYNADLYAEYNLKLGKTNLQFSVNISNLFNFKIARNIWETKHLGSLYITEWQVLLRNWDYPDTAIPDPRFMMPYNYTPPISARVGMKLSF